MKQTQDQLVQDMRKQCRMAMDGMKSASMRVMGLEYKLNFGLVLQQIDSIAKRYEPNAQLAQRLWKEQTRELIILGTLLYPISEFTPQQAEEWAKGIPNQEIREQVCLNLFQELPFADQLAIEWANDANDDMRTTGYWLLARLLLAKKYEGILDTDFFHIADQDMVSEHLFLRNAALLVLKHIGRQSEADAQKVLLLAAPYKDHTNILKQEAYNTLAFEFDFIWG